ncbi:putative Ig domain-containing protein [Dietzia sp.]|uniref:putative Ig domain-containing protein n=1 Tax=Dietzia sp. TaxID=1871616 RepID=UPI002FDA67DA
MRARFIRSQGRVATRGRFFVPVAAAAAVALAAGTVVAVNPFEDGSDVALSAETGAQFGSAQIGSGASAGAAFFLGQAVDLNIKQLAHNAGLDLSWALNADGSFKEGVVVSGLPTGLDIDLTTGVISGTPTASGSYTIKVSFEGRTVSIPVVVGTQDALSLLQTGDFNGAIEAVLGSLGNGTTSSNTTTTGTEGTVGTEATGEGNGQVNVQSSGSSTPGGSLGEAVPYLAVTGALLLGLAAAGTLGAGSTAPGGTLNAGSNGSTGGTNGGTNTGSNGSNGSTGSNDSTVPGGSLGSSNAKPTAPAKTAPGPEVNNGRG